MLPPRSDIAETNQGGIEGNMRDHLKMFLPGQLLAPKQAPPCFVGFATHSNSYVEIPNIREFHIRRPFSDRLQI